MAAQPVVWLTVIGRRSGERRRVPLTGIPLDQDIAVIGSYFGSRGHPAWALNLEATPEAEASIGDRTIGVRGRGATAAEEVEIWRLAGLIYPGYALYRERVTRSIKVFVLESARLPSEQ
jgi:deazaflavin-dependent oxidoreductase (nitroreductase family)